MFSEINVFNDGELREITSFICNRIGRNYCGETEEWGERENDREREESRETVHCRERVFMPVINLTVGQISRSLEMDNPLEEGFS